MSLDKRLLSCYELIVDCICVADIGTDHAYLPIELVKDKKAQSAIASDISPGAVSVALNNVRKSGFEKEISVILCDGLKNKAFECCNEIVIAGMGGDTIVSILKDSLICLDGKHLVLQPMTKQHVLRKYLWDNGYDIDCERFVEPRYYQILSASKSNIPYLYDEIELYIGKKGTEISSKLAGKIYRDNCKIISALKRSGRDTGELSEFNARILHESKRFI